MQIPLFLIGLGSKKNAIVIFNLVVFFEIRAILVLKIICVIREILPWFLH